VISEIHPYPSTPRGARLEEAPKEATEVVRQLSASSELAGLPIARVIRDTPFPDAFPNEDVYRAAAERAGFRLVVDVVAHRRGYEHRLMMVRGTVVKASVM